MFATTPPPRPPGEITRLLDAWQSGDADALDDLIVRLYRDLRRIAQGLVNREQRVPTLQATALVHEIFLRLDASSGRSADAAKRWRTRRHFFAVASMMMRRILIDAARRRAMKRRHGLVALDTVDAASALPAPVTPAEELILVHAALERLAEREPELAKVVELRFFLGLDCAETAAVLEVSERTVKRRWRKAKGELSTILDPPTAP